MIASPTFARMVEHVLIEWITLPVLVLQDGKVAYVLLVSEFIYNLRRHI